MNWDIDKRIFSEFTDMHNHSATGKIAKFIEKCASGFGKCRR